MKKKDGERQKCSSVNNRNGGENVPVHVVLYNCVVILNGTMPGVYPAKHVHDGAPIALGGHATTACQ